MTRRRSKLTCDHRPADNAEAAEIGDELRRDSEANTSRLLVAARGAELFGCIQYGLTADRLTPDNWQVWQRWTTRREADGVPEQSCDVIGELYVQPSARGNGIGRLLISAATLDMATAGARHVELQLLSADVPLAKPLYESMGFQETYPSGTRGKLGVFSLELTGPVQQNLLRTVQSATKPVGSLVR